MKTVGEILKKARLKKKLTRHKLSKKTKISAKYIKALENNDFNALPEAAFVKGFIRNYANAVDLDPEQALAVFRRDYDQDVKGQVIPRSLLQTEKEKHSIWTPKTTALAVLAVLTVAFASYFLYQYRLLAGAPPLEIESPKEEERVKPTITIIGKTDSQATVTINNQQVWVNPDGSFSQSLVLPEGTRTITIHSKSRSGKSRTVQRTVHVESQ
jgi:cytoskeletal protein RodZ